jgi:hypothetical protein
MKTGITTLHDVLDVLFEVWMNKVDGDGLVEVYDPHMLAQYS